MATMVVMLYALGTSIIGSLYHQNGESISQIFFASKAIALHKIITTVKE
jgi:hypothetical protein